MYKAMTPACKLDHQINFFLVRFRSLANGYYISNAHEFDVYAFLAHSLSEVTMRSKT